MDSSPPLSFLLISCYCVVFLSCLVLSCLFLPVLSCLFFLSCIVFFYFSCLVFFFLSCRCVCLCLYLYLLSESVCICVVSVSVCLSLFFCGRGCALARRRTTSGAGITPEPASSRRLRAAPAASTEKRRHRNSSPESQSEEGRSDDSEESDPAVPPRSLPSSRRGDASVATGSYTPIPPSALLRTPRSGIPRAMSPGHRYYTKSSETARRTAVQQWFLSESPATSSTGGGYTPQPISSVLPPVLRNSVFQLLLFFVHHLHSVPCVSANALSWKTSY